MKALRHFWKVSLLSLLSMGILSGYKGGCGVEIPPSGSCSQDADCGPGYRCERQVYLRGGEAPVTNSGSGQTRPAKTSASSTEGSVGIRCIGAAEGSDLKTRCAIAPEPDQSFGQCVKISPPPPKPPVPGSCQSDRDCGPNAFCSYPKPRCASDTTIEDPAAPIARCGGAVPSQGICQPRPVPPPLPPARSCDEASECNAGEICSFEAQPQPAPVPKPSPLPVEDAGSAPSVEPAEGGHGEGEAPSEGGRVIPGGLGDKKPAIPTCMPEPQPEPPVRRGICVPAPKQPCSADADCKNGQLCAFPVDQTKPVPPPSSTCTTDSAGNTVCSGSAPANSTRNASDPTGRRSCDAPVPPPLGVCIDPLP